MQVAHKIRFAIAAAVLLVGAQAVNAQSCQFEKNAIDAITETQVKVTQPVTVHIVLVLLLIVQNLHQIVVRESVEGVQKMHHLAEFVFEIGNLLLVAQNLHIVAARHNLNLRTSCF